MKLNLALLASLLATPVLAQNHPTYPHRGLDKLGVATEGYTAVVTYYNSESKTSRMVSETHTVGNLEFSVEVVVGIDEPETLIIKAITPGYQVIPQEVTKVEDGDEVTIYIIPLTG